MFYEHVGDVLHMSATFGGSNTVDERDLLKAIVGRADCNFPAITTLFVLELQWVSAFIFSVLQKHVDVFFEVFHLKQSRDENYHLYSSILKIVCHNQTYR